MLTQLLAPKFVILYVFIGCGLFIHFRGRVKHKFLRQLTDHSTFMAPYNVLVYLFSRVPNKPVLDRDRFSELDVFRDNWETIRDEARALYEGEHIVAASKKNDIAFNSFFKRGWKRFYLKWYDDFQPSAKELCPKTVALVESVPSVNAALFTMMEPQSRLGEHRDPFAGSLRYHLGLMTPNSEKCRIYIDGEPYAWKDGDDILFDETFIHSVENETDERRIIFFADVDRPLYQPMRAFNNFVTRQVVKITKAQNNDTEKVGFVNYLSAGVYKLKDFFKACKKANRRLYYAGKYTVFAVVIYLIFFAGFHISKDKPTEEAIAVTSETALAAENDAAPPKTAGPVLGSVEPTVDEVDVETP